MLHWRRDKPKEVVCTICSKEKAQGPVLMPARKRYLGHHIGLAASAARFKPFFILSGVYGLIPADTSIPYYDHRLGDDEVEKLAGRVAQQVRHHKIRSFFTCMSPRRAGSPTPRLSARVSLPAAGE